MIQTNVWYFVCCLTSLACCSSFGATYRMQLCVSKCKTAFCKKVAEDLEFEFEMAGEFLVPPCKSKKLYKNETQLTVSGKGKDVQVELKCEGNQTCLNQNYDETMKGAALIARIASDVKAAIKHHKPFAPSLAKAVPLPSPEPIRLSEEKWDRVVAEVVKPAQIESAPQTAMPRAKPLGSTSLSFGGEIWNYAFAPDQADKRIGDVHSRVYPRVALCASYWPFSFMRISGAFGTSMAHLRLRANQPVVGDGQIVSMHMFQGSLITSYFLDIGSLLKVGADLGYDFVGSLVDRQRFLDRDVTIVPSFQSHGLRLGPRLVLGEFSDLGLIDVAAAFYPYTYYIEAPDEPASGKSLWSFGLQGYFRLMLSADLFLDATAKMHSFFVRYSELALRETPDSEKWGSGEVSNATMSFAAGIGCLF